MNEENFELQYKWVTKELHLPRITRDVTPTMADVRLGQLSTRHLIDCCPHHRVVLV